MTSDRPAFQQHAKHTEGNDTTPRLAHSESTERRVYKPQLRQKRKRSRSPAGPRRLGTATRIMRIAVPKAFCVLREHTRPRPKSGKVCRSDTWPRRVSETCETLRGYNSPPSETPLFRRVSRCVRSCWQRRVCTHFHPQKRMWAVLQAIATRPFFAV